MPLPLRRTGVGRRTREIELKHSCLHSLKQKNRSSMANVVQVEIPYDIESLPFHTMSTLMYVRRRSAGRQAKTRCIRLVDHFADENVDKTKGPPSVRKETDISERLKPLSAEKHGIVKCTTSLTPHVQVQALSSGSGYVLRGIDFAGLVNTNNGLLNDEVVNAYASLVNARNKSYFAKRSMTLLCGGEGASQASTEFSDSTHEHRSVRADGADCNRKDTMGKTCTFVEEMALIEGGRQRTPWFQ